MDEPIISARIRVPPPIGLRRARLERMVDTTWRVPLTVVVAPAGSGKTTMLAMFAQAERGAGRVVAWYQAGSSEAGPTGFLRYLENAVRQWAPELAPGWASVGAAAAALEAAQAPVAIVIDDSHTLLSTSAEEALEQLVSYLPPSVHIVMAGRHPPAFDLPKWRLSGQITEIGPDDLRFRHWEVEELFARHYGVRLLPQEVAELARRTGGWAAGLSLFRLATADRPASERRRVLSSMSSRLPDARDYLTRNVLAALDADQQDFLVRTCVLGRLSGPWCDELLGSTGSARRLEELAQRHLFLVSHDGGNTFQQHEVLRSFLEELLLDQLGEQQIRALYATAGKVLEGGGAFSEALRAYCRAQDWGAADRLLGLSGDRVVDPLGPWADSLPPALADHDAWYLLAIARRQVRSGHWTEALDSYRRAEQLAAGALVRRTCQRERFQLAGWMDPGTTVAHDWAGILRQALARNPLSVLDGPTVSGRPDFSTPGYRLAAGLAAVLAGHLERAYNLLGAEPDDDDHPGVLGFLAEALSHETERLTGRAGRSTGLPSYLDSLDAHLPPWLARLLHAARGPQSAFLAELENSRGEVMATENPWTDLLFLLVEGVFLLVAGSAAQATERLEGAATTAHALGVPVLAAWARATAALGALRHDPGAAAAGAAAASKMARSVGCPGADALGLLVEAAAAGDPAWRHAAGALERAGAFPMAALVAHFLPSSGHVTADGTGPNSAGTLAGSGPTLARHRPEATGHEVEVRCLGPFLLMVGGRPMDTGLARPRVRGVLHYLALQAGSCVHRDALGAALWPHDEARTARHNLQAAVSSLRQLLEAQGGPGAGALVGRRGESYVLDVANGPYDMDIFATKHVSGRAARHAGRPQAAISDLREALAVYRGELLPEAGTAEWVLAPREHHRLTASGASQLLAEVLLETGEAAEAATVAAWGLAVDRYCDGLWKVMIAAHDQGANQAAGARTRSDYQRVLAELGVTSADW